MLLHAAFGGSTNLLLHIPALAYAAGLERPAVEDWHRINKQTPRLVDALPNGHGSGPATLNPAIQASSGSSWTTVPAH